MKKFFLFIASLFILILSEYYFLNEVFAQRRWPVILVCTGGLLLCIGVFFRFFKTSVVSR